MPTFLFVETPDPENIELYKSNLENVKVRYKDSLIILKDGKFGKRNLGIIPQDYNNVFPLINPTIPILKYGQIDKAMGFLDKVYKLLNKNKYLIIFRKKASLFSAISFGYLSGYKKIVLCGIDLNTPGYFYEENPDYYQSQGLQFPENKNVVVHKTSINKDGGINIVELIDGFNRVVLSKNGVHLSVLNEQSELAKVLPVYPN